MGQVAFSVLYYALWPCCLQTYHAINGVILHQYAPLAEEERGSRLGCALWVAQTTPLDR